MPFGASADAISAILRKELVAEVCDDFSRCLELCDLSPPIISMRIPMGKRLCENIDFLSSVDLCFFGHDNLSKTTINPAFYLEKNAFMTYYSMSGMIEF